MASSSDTSTTATCSQAAFRSLNKVVSPAVKAGVGNPLPVGSGLVILETVGRTSGKARQVPLVASRLGNTIMVSTVRPSSQWVKNLQATPQVKVWVGGTKRSATASIVSSAPLTVVSLALD